MLFRAWGKPVKVRIAWTSVVLVEWRSPTDKSIFHFSFVIVGSLRSEKSNEGNFELPYISRLGTQN